MGIIDLSELSVLRGRNKVLDKWYFQLLAAKLCLHGENGCGKSALIEAAAGLIPLENGSSTISANLFAIQTGAAATVSAYAYRMIV